MKKFLCLLMALAMLAALAACGTEPATTPTQPTGDGLTMDNMILGESYAFTYADAPQRIVTLASPATEMLLALGLEESIVGYAMQDNEIPEKYKAAFDSLYCITSGWTVSQEMIMALEPDFLMFWNGSPDYTYEFLTANNMSTYTLTSDIDGAKIDSVYKDFENMGKIFHKEDRAAQIIGEMKAKIDPVKEKTAALDPVSVVYVDAYSSDEAAFTAGDALVADIFRAAGGRNIIDNTTDPWLNVSWEQIAAANPQWVVIGVYEGASDADYWIDFLKNHPACSEMDAVKNDRFIVTGLADLTVGERVADTVPMLAESFHP